MNENNGYDTEKFVDSLNDFGIRLTPVQLNQFMKYYELLITRNESVNLTAITDFDGVMMKHFTDSVAFSVLNLPTEGKTMIDVGTGAGFPGIPLKIIYPELQITLLDSLNKRISFLNQVIEELGLRNVRTVHLRAEEAGKNPEYREQFDYCVSRAVANLSTLAEYCIPLVKITGKFISYKTADSDEEIIDSYTALKKMNAKVERCNDVIIRYGKQRLDRRLVVITKTAQTPERYPRKAGIPSKRPLK